MHLDTQSVGIAAGILTAVSMIPQLIKTFTEKKADNISVVMILVLMSGLGCWITYGCMRNDLPVIFTNMFSLLVNSILLVLRLYYGKKNRRKG